MTALPTAVPARAALTDADLVLGRARNRISTAWAEACWALGVRSDRAALEELLARLAEPHRRYHDLTHVEACVNLFDDHRGEARRPGEVLFAILFHDAVYDPHRTDNEEASAALAHEVLARLDADAPVIDHVAHLIRCTATHEPGGDADAEILLDVDLSILGEPEDVYERFEHAIRQEYAFVPDDAFRAARRAVLERLLARPAIYRVPALAREREAQARANLSRAIAALGG